MATYNVTLTSEEHEIDQTIECADDTFVLDAAEELGLVNEQRKAQDGYQPLPADVSDEAAMIPGFKEGIRLLNVGDEATLFLPYELAYGEQGGRGIPAKSNLIFEVKVVKLFE